MKHLALLRLALGALVALSAGAAFADVDPPGRVGRLSYLDGVVSFHTADQTEWSPATLNYPVVAGQSFWTEPQSRAEIQVGPAEFRLDEATALDIVALDDGRTHLGLAQGTINVHLRAVPPGGVVVLTSQGSITLLQAGSYRIEAGAPVNGGPPDRMAVTVLEGRAQVSGPRRAIDVLPGESAVLMGNPAGVTLVEGNSTPFDDWALERERREAAFAATRYVSPETTGYQDLDDYGQWRTEPTYGTVWYPAVPAADWAPYRYGHWAWVAPWGWTWIDDAPWGFAPFHYGRWAFIGGRWGWCPGIVVARPVYAPALVAFVGGSGWGVNIASGPTLAAVGWVPLAPFEVYHPYYRSSVAYVRNVNITSVNRTVVNNITNVTVVNRTTVVNNYANRRAATVVPSAAFTRAAPVHRAALDVPHDEMARARVMPTVEHLRPTPAARAGGAIPAAAEMHGTRPHEPASIARTPVRAEFVPPGRAEPSVPTAPGPEFGRRPDRNGPPRAAYAPLPQRDAAPPVTRAAPPSAPAQVPGHRDEARPAQALGRRDEARPAPVPNLAGPLMVRPVQPPAPPQPPAAPRAPVVAAPQRQAPPPAAAPPQRPAPPVERPAQQTRLAPTPQGWARAPQPAQAAPQNRPAPQAAPQNRPAPTAKPAPAHAPGKDGRPSDDHKPGG
jgi:uncharacterized protein DUF6600